MSEITLESLSKIARQLNPLLALVYLNDGIEFSEALDLMAKRLPIPRLWALACYFKCKRDGLITIELDQELKPCIFLTVKGLRRVAATRLRHSALARLSEVG